MPGEDRGLAELALVFGRLLLEDVAREGVASAHLAGAGDFEALLRAGVCLHLGHSFSAVDYDTVLPAAGGAPLPSGGPTRCARSLGGLRRGGLGSALRRRRRGLGGGGGVLLRRRLER